MHQNHIRSNSPLYLSNSCFIPKIQCKRTYMFEQRLSRERIYVLFCIFFPPRPRLSYKTLQTLCLVYCTSIFGNVTISELSKCISKNSCIMHSLEQVFSLFRANHGSNAFYVNGTFPANKDSMLGQITHMKENPQMARPEGSGFISMRGFRSSHRLIALPLWLLLLNIHL